MSVESEAYKIPTRDAIAGIYRPYDRLVPPGNFPSVAQVAKEMSFMETEGLPTRKANWYIYDRPDFVVPNFEAPGTVTHSALAVYHREYQEKDSLGRPIAVEKDAHVVLRQDAVPFARSEFLADLETLTGYFFERPRFWGFPAQELSFSRLTTVGGVTGLAVGLPVSLMIYNSTEGFNYQIFSLFMGSTVGMLAGTATSLMAENRAANKVAGLNNYWAEGNAASILTAEQSHLTDVNIKTEFYNKLKQAGVDLKPNEFLDRYQEIPQRLINLRWREMGGNKPSVALPKMLEFAKLLQTI